LRRAQKWKYEKGKPRVRAGGRPDLGYHECWWGTRTLLEQKGGTAGSAPFIAKAKREKLGARRRKKPLTIALGVVELSPHTGLEGDLRGPGLRREKSQIGLKEREKNELSRVSPHSEFASPPHFLGGGGSFISSIESREKGQVKGKKPASRRMTIQSSQRIRKIPVHRKRRKKKPYDGMRRTRKRKDLLQASPTSQRRH